MDDIIGLMVGSVKVKVVKTAANILTKDLEQIEAVSLGDENGEGATALDPELIQLIRTEAAIRSMSGVATMVKVS